MKYTQILVIGRHSKILEIVLRLINCNDDWNAQGTTEVNDAIELFKKNKFDLVLLGGGIDVKSELKLREIFASIDPDIKIIQHWGGGSGLLQNEIISALSGFKDGNYYIQNEIAE